MVAQALAHVPAFRNFFMREANYASTRSPLGASIRPRPAAILTSHAGLSSPDASI